MNFLAASLERLKRQTGLGDGTGNRIEAVQPAADGASVERDSVTIERRRDLTIVELGGFGQAPPNGSQTLGTRLIDLIESERPAKLHIDLGRIERLTSETLNQLIQVNCHARTNGTQLVLGNLSQPLQEVFRVTRLDRLFDLTAAESASRD